MNTEATQIAAELNDAMQAAQQQRDATTQIRGIRTDEFPLRAWDPVSCTDNMLLRRADAWLGRLDATLIQIANTLARWEPADGTEPEPFPADEPTVRTGRIYFDPDAYDGLDPWIVEDDQGIAVRRRTLASALLAIDAVDRPVHPGIEAWDLDMSAYYAWQRGE